MEETPKKPIDLQDQLENAILSACKCYFAAKLDEITIKPCEEPICPITNQFK